MMKNKTAKINYRGKTLIIGGFIGIGVLFLIYSQLQNPSLTPEVVSALERIGILFYVSLLISFGAIAFGLNNYRKERIQENNGTITSIIFIVTQNKKSKRIFVTTFVLYGIFFSFSSGILVYQPEVVFSYHYGATIPSAHITPCCGDPGYMPKFVAYLTEHVGLQVIPINFVLQMIVSYLVALNVTLAVNAISISKKGGGLSGIGATTGLFIACPTCVGTFLALFIGSSSAVAFTVAITELQTLFIAVTIPVLLATPTIIGNKLKKSLDGSCQV